MEKQLTMSSYTRAAYEVGSRHYFSLYRELELDSFGRVMCERVSSHLCCMGTNVEKYVEFHAPSKREMNFGAHVYAVH